MLALGGHHIPHNFDSFLPPDIKKDSPFEISTDTFSSDTTHPDAPFSTSPLHDSASSSDSESSLSSISDDDPHSSISIGLRDSGEDLLKKCSESKYYLQELILEGTPGSPLTLSGEDLLNLNSEEDLLCTLTDFTLKQAPQIDSEQIVQFLVGMDASVSLKKLVLDVLLTDEQVLKILERHPQLEILDLGPSLRDAALRHMASKGNELKKLIIHSSANDLSSDAINTLFASLTNVESLLWLGSSAAIHTEQLQTLLTHAKAMTHAVLMGCKLTAEDARKILSENNKPDCSLTISGTDPTKDRDTPPFFVNQSQVSLGRSKEHFIKV